MNDVASGVLADAGWRFLRDQAGVLVLLIDKTETIRFANAHARALTGLSLEGGPLEQILLGFPQDQPVRWLATAPGETRLVNVRTAGGLPETLYATLVPVGDDLLLFAQTDAGEQARLRKEVLVLNHELGNLGRELAQRNADLAELNEQKTWFLGMATHDLRKPAGLVLSYAEMLTEELGAAMIEQVFTNLMSNAIEHAPDGSTVRVDGRVDGDAVRFSVTDTGPGISEEQRARLFGAFSATGGRKKDGERSIGLGLAISRRIVEAHGGRMFATGMPGTGASVGFTLPATCLTQAPQADTRGGG